MATTTPCTSPTRSRGSRTSPRSTTSAASGRTSSTKGVPASSKAAVICRKVSGEVRRTAACVPTRSPTSVPSASRLCGDSSTSIRNKPHRTKPSAAGRQFPQGRPTNSMLLADKFHAAGRQFPQDKPAISARQTDKFRKAGNKTISKALKYISKSLKYISKALK